VEELGRRLGYKPGDFSAYYNLTIKDFVAHGGRSLIIRFNNRPSALLRAVFPEYDWLPWRFKYTPARSYEDPVVMKKAIAFVERELKLREVSEWHRVTLPKLRALGVDNLFLHNGGVVAALAKFPSELK